MAGLEKFNLNSETQGIESLGIRYGHIVELMKYYCGDESYDPVKIIEIGSWVGASAITWGNSVKSYCPHGGSVFCIDPWAEMWFNPIFHTPAALQQQFFYMENNIFEVFRQNVSASNLSDMIVPLRGKSEDILPGQPDDYFDIVYIDGNHWAQSVVQDISLAMPKIREGGIICGDDLELQAHEVDREELYVYAINQIDYVNDTASGIAYHPGVTLGVSTMFGSVGVMDGFWFMKKQSNKWVEFEFPRASSPPIYIVTPQQ